jgi:LCP family protein required for cell wall assembly
MSDYNRHGQDVDDGAYTGETIVMPRRRAEPARAPRLPRRAPRRIWPIVRVALLALVSLALIGVVVAYLQVRALASEIVVRDVRPNRTLATTPGSFNLLLVGVDARPGHPEEGVRGDTLVVVHADMLGRWAGTLSIPRDTRAEVPGVGATKVNVAYGQGYAAAVELYGPGTTPEQGGMALAAETVEQFLDLPSHGQRIDYVATINFDGFARVVDALGGITVDVPQPIVDDDYPTPDFGTMRVEFEPGVQRMDGERALIYARTRHADDDFGRAARQQQVIRAIADEIRGRGLFGKLALISKLRAGLGGSVTTTLPFGRLDMLAGLGWLAGGIDPGDINQVRLSPESAPSVQEDGSDLIWNPGEVSAVVDSFLTRPSEADEAATVQVLNGTDTGGLAGRKSTELEQAGFTVIPAGNTPASDVQKTVVYDLTGKPQTSRRLAETLGADVRRGPPPEGVESPADIVVILGNDAVAK